MLRGATFLRVIAAGPGALATAFLVMAALPLALPTGRAGVDHLIVPLVAFPGIWAALFFYACLDRRAGRAALIVSAVAVAAAVPVALHLFG